MTDSTHSRMPRHSTTFVGRTSEQNALEAALATNRLTFVIGPGGVGKTRLVTSVLAKGYDKTDTAAGSTYFADLRQITGVGELCARIAEALGMRDGSAADSVSVIDFARELKGLLLLDSCEGIDRESQQCLQELVWAATGLTLVATSRRVLRVDGAELMTLSPLPVPSAEGDVTAAQVDNFDAAKLFADRARLLSPTFEIADSNAAALARLLHGLDGLPLAIELAAGWVRALSLQQIIDRMNARPDFPRGDSTSLHPRHRTLQTLTEGSFQLSTEAEQLLWCRLTVFAGTFDLSAVEAVCSSAPLREADLLDHMASLVDQSIVIVDNQGAHARYRLPRLIRDYGNQHLDERDDRDQLIRRHFDHYENRVQLAAHSVRDSGPEEGTAQLLIDFANIAVAIDYGLTDSTLHGVSARMATDLWHFWFATGQLTRGLEMLERVLAATSGPSAYRELAYCVAAYLYLLQDNLRYAERLVEHAGEIQAVSRDPLNRAFAMQLAGMIAMGYGRTVEASPLVDASAELYRSLEGSFARELYLDTTGVAVMCAVFNGDTDRATVLAEHGLAMCEESKDYFWRGYIELVLGIASWVSGDHEGARGAAIRAMGYTADQLLTTHCVELLAWCAQSARTYIRAARLFGGADRMWQFLGGSFSGFRMVVAYRDDSIRATREHAGERPFHAAYELGRHMTLAELVAYAIETETEPDDSGLTVLTRRELEVARLVAAGLSNRDIAADLTISQRTVETHVEHILSKLGLENRTRVAAWIHARTPATG
ncbi:hypothetical protein HQO26_07160 [Rhodococcus fascians]|nr:hypothetical protein [Rhodococcus fascians]MBY4417247.1 hypothetical protein [Rhodococcus fascians]